MKRYPVVSVVTPSLNQGRFIEETIQSVLSQEGDFYLDYIICDGASTDNTLEIIKGYDTLLSRGHYPVKCKGIQYHWFSEPDKGQANAINKGFRKAKGEILAWLNSDDRYVGSAFWNVTNAFLSLNNPYVIYGNLNIIDEKGKLTSSFKSRPYEGMYRLIESCWNTSASFLVQPAVFFRRECLQGCDLLDEHLNALFDYDLFIRIARKYKFCYLNKTLAEFRIYPESKSGYMDVSYILERIKISRRYWVFLPRREQDKMKVDATRFFIRKLFLRMGQAFNDKDFLQFFKCSLHFLKEVMCVLFDKSLRRKTIDSIKKYKLRCLSG